MVKNPPEGMPQCCPVVLYDDVAQAVAFLTRAFGFGERFVDRNHGKVEHAQLASGSAVVMLGWAGAPHALRPCATPKRSGTQNANVYMFVDDVDAHCARARAAGATIVLEPCDMHWGDRIYCAEDPEGQFWTFATHTRDVPPEEM
jgi:PhnB protein